MGIIVTLLVVTLIVVTILLMIVTGLLIHERIQRYKLFEQYRKVREYLRSNR